MQKRMGMDQRKFIRYVLSTLTEYDNAPQSEINASQPAVSTDTQRPKRENKAGLKS